MKFTLPVNFSNLEANKDFVRWAAQVFESIYSLFNRNISFVDNCKTSLVSVTFAASNTQQAVPHTLGKIPTGYMTVGSASSGVVYAGASQSTTQYIYLQCTTAETKNLLIF